MNSTLIPHFANDDANLLQPHHDRHPKEGLKKVHCSILSMMQILTYAVEGTQSVHVFNVLRVCLQSL